jgi:hypothetical protein
VAKNETVGSWLRSVSWPLVVAYVFIVIAVGIGVRVARIPSPAELGITDITPGAGRYVQTLGDSLIAGQIAYYEARLERFPRLQCVEHNDRFVAEPKG